MHTGSYGLMSADGPVQPTGPGGQEGQHPNVAGLVGSGTSARRGFHGQAGYGARPGDHADSRGHGGAGARPGARGGPGLAGVERQDPAGPLLRRVAVAFPRSRRADLGGGQQPGVGAVRLRAGGRGDGGQRRGRRRVGGGPVRRLAQQDHPAVARRARRPARRGGPAGALAVRPGGQAADHDRQSGGHIRRAPGAGPAGAGLQHPGGDGLPVRPPQHRPGPAQRGDRPGGRPRLRADRAGPGQRGDRQLGHVLPRLPAALHAAAEAARGGGPGRAVGRRGHLDVLGRVRRAPVAGREHPVAGDAGRAARRPRDTRRRVHHARRPASTSRRTARPGRAAGRTRSGPGTRSSA